MKLKDARSLSPLELEERRKQAVKLRERGMKYSDISEIVGVNRNKVSEWYKLWLSGGSKALKVKSRGKPKGSGCTLDPDQQNRVRCCLITCTPDQLQFNFALWTRAAVRQLIAHLFKIDMPIRTVGHYLKQWGFTPQKPVKRSYERCSKRVQKWLNEEYPEIERKAHEEGAEIHWGDETGVCNQDQVGRGYAPKGKTPVRERKGKKERVNMISTVTKLGKIRFMFYEGSMNYQQLIKFMRRLIKDTDKKVYLILDNLRVHHAKKVKEWVNQKSESIELHYLPSYSTDLNPDEYLNRDLKAELSRRPSGRKDGHFKSQAQTEMRRLQKSPARVRKYFHGSSIKYAA